jgi:hypothetical protein
MASTSVPSTREQLHYPTLAESKARALNTFATNRYAAYHRPLHLTAVTDTMATQTDDVPTRETAAGPTTGEVQARRHELRLGLCSPHDLPVMAVTQLLEAERRVADLLNCIEEEIARAEAEDRRQRSADDAIEDAQAAEAARCARSTSAWNERMSQTIDRRLRRRHNDPTGVTPSVFWHRAKLGYVSSPMRQRQDQGSPTRDRARLLKMGEPVPPPSER